MSYKNVPTISSAKDSFDDEELAMMAADIMRDLRNNPNLDPTDSSSYMFSYQSNQSKQTTNDPSDATKLHSSCPPSLSLSASRSTNAQSIANMIYLNYPSQSPYVVSDRPQKTKLTKNLSTPIPSLPNTPKHGPMPPPQYARTPSPKHNTHKSYQSTVTSTYQKHTTHKSGINGWCTQQGTYDTCTYTNKLPYIPPPSLYLDHSTGKSVESEIYENSIVSQLSPRSEISNRAKRTQSQTQIPDFSEYKQKKKVTINTKYKQKKRVVSPISINIKKKSKAKRHRKKRSNTKNNHGISRAFTVGNTSKSYTNDVAYEYAVESDMKIYCFCAL